MMTVYEVSMNLIHVYKVWCILVNSIGITQCTVSSSVLVPLKGDFQLHCRFEFSLREVKLFEHSSCLADEKLTGRVWITSRFWDFDCIGQKQHTPTPINIHMCFLTVEDSSIGCSKPGHCPGKILVNCAYCLPLYCLVGRWARTQ